MHRTVASKRNAACYLGSAQNQPERIRNYFEREPVRFEPCYNSGGARFLTNFFRVESSHFGP